MIKGNWRWRFHHSVKSLSSFWSKYVKQYLMHSLNTGSPAWIYPRSESFANNCLHQNGLSFVNCNQKLSILWLAGDIPTQQLPEPVYSSSCCDLMVIFTALIKLFSVPPSEQVLAVNPTILFIAFKKYHTTTDGSLFVDATSSHVNFLE